MGAPGQVTFGSASHPLLTPKPQCSPIIWDGRVGVGRKGGSSQGVPHRRWSGPLEQKGRR